MPLGTTGHHYFLLLSRWVCEGIFLSRLGQNENDDSINLGGSLALGVQCQLLCAVCLGPLRTSLGKSALSFLPPRRNSFLQVAMSFPLFQTFLQWYLPRLASFMFIRSSTSFHPAPQVYFILYTAFPHIYILCSASLAELKVRCSSLQRLTL